MARKRKATPPEPENPIVDPLSEASVHSVTKEPEKVDKRRKKKVVSPATPTVDLAASAPVKSATQELDKIEKLPQVKSRKKKEPMPAKSAVNPTPAGNTRSKKVPAPATSVIDLEPEPLPAGKTRRKKVPVPATSVVDREPEPLPAGKTRKKVPVPDTSVVDLEPEALPAGNARNKKVPAPGTSVVDLDPEPAPPASSKIGAKGRVKINQLFFSYADSTGVIGPEGIESLCSDLGVVHTDVRILMLAWKMQAKKQGYFTLDEWQKHLKKHATISELKNSLVDLEEEVKWPSKFEDFYSYAFRYCLTEEMQKTVDIETICILLDLVLGSKFPPQVDSFTKFLKTQSDYKVLNLDQWVGFHRFCNEVSFPGLGNFDPYAAWPSILDDFVDWIKLEDAKSI